MKKFIIAALAASVVTAPVMAAPWDGHNDRGRMEQRHDNRGTQEQRFGHRQWQRGQRFDRRYAPNYQVIAAPHSYHLRPAPRGYHWVRSGNDAVLIGVTTGIIASVLANAIR
jgi:Ni/Co efflux regulator RcnB